MLKQFFYFQMVLRDIIFLVLLPFKWYKINKINQFITSGIVDKAAFGLLVADALAMFEVLFKALP